MTVGASAAAFRKCESIRARIPRYYRRKDRTVFLLLCGGDKGSQRADISRAQNLAREF